MLIAAELEEGMRLNTANVKQLCSTDEIYAEKKYKDPFSYTPTHTLVLYTNHLPKVGAIDKGTWRRLIVIPFDAKIEGSADIKNYADYLFEKAGGAILTWVIEGARKVIADNYKIDPPQKVRDAIEHYKESNPHDYQTYATNFVLEHPVAAVLLEMGLGKSVITLTAIFELLYNRFEVGKVLVIAPLRVARDTWPAEIEKWDHLKGLTYSVVIGTESERKEALRKSAGIYLINRENVDWLINKSGFPFDFDMVVIDELSSFKSASAKRFKSLLKVRPKLKRIVGLTGTPSSNGLMDLWAEFRILDMGERLGRYITHYRMNFFVPDKRNQQMIFSYKPRPGAEDAIYRLISDITISMKSADFLKMPECIMNEVEVKLSEKEWSVCHAKIHAERGDYQGGKKHRVYSYDK